MKRIFYFLGAVAVTAMLFSCKKDNNGKKVDVNDVVNDAVYVLGDAVGTTTADAKYAMVGVAINDAVEVNEGETKPARDDAYEKYIYLEGGKAFYLYKVAGETKTEIKGALKAGENGVYVGTNNGSEMKVAESGLYHVVYDGPTEDIAVIPAKMAIKGAQWASWGEAQFMEVTSASATQVVFTFDAGDINATEFKFQNGLTDWGYQVNDAFKIHTNLGADMLPNGSNLSAPKTDNAVFTLTWTLADAAKWTENFSWKVEGVTAKNTPETLVVGLSGEFNGWGGPELATFDAAASSFTQGDLDFEGTVVYTIKNLAVNGMFKVRINGSWDGGDAVEVDPSGVQPEVVTTDNNNFKVAEGTYDFTISFDWANGAASNKKIKIDEVK